MDILLGNEAQEKLMTGIMKASKIVGSTMGPNGRTVIIPDYDGGVSKYRVTKDGVSVIKSIRLKDPAENIGVKLLQEAAENTVREAGDGTTTSTVLASAFIVKFQNGDPNMITEAFDRLGKATIEALQKSSRKLHKEDIKHVATISANNDEVMGDLIQNAFNHSTVVRVEPSTHNEDKLETVNGMMLEVGTLTPRVITDIKKQSVKFIKPLVVTLSDKIESLKTLNVVLNYAIAESRPVVIITEYITPGVIETLENYFLSSTVDVCVVKAPGFSAHRKNLLADIATFTGGKLVSGTKKILIEDLGHLAEIVITSKNTILTKAEDVDITEYADNLEYQFKNNELDETAKDLLNTRIELLKGTVSVIKVGGRSEIEMEERKDRYDDAVLAVTSALSEGIVEGGGVALAKIALPNLRILEGELRMSNPPTVEELFNLSLLAPLMQIDANGFSIKITEDTNLFNDNIVDPLKVTRCALENALSVAKTILSTQSIVLSSFEWKD